MCVGNVARNRNREEKKTQFTLLYREPFWRRRNGLLHAAKSLLVKKVPKTAHCSCELLGDWLRSLKSENRKKERLTRGWLSPVPCRKTEEFKVGFWA